MANIISTLKNAAGDVIYPRTAAGAVYTGDHTLLTSALSDLSDGLSAKMNAVPVTQADEGKFLRVSGGRWAAVSLDSFDGEAF